MSLQACLSHDSASCSRWALSDTKQMHDLMCGMHVSGCTIWAVKGGAITHVLMLPPMRHSAYLQDPKKRKWVDSLAADVVYVSGRKRAPGEMNGKSGNINNVCSQLYPPGTVVPGNELICIFDADQVLPSIVICNSCRLPLMLLPPDTFLILKLHAARAA